MAMWANALVATILNAILAVVLARTARRSWRNRRLGAVGAMHAGPRASLWWVTGAMVIHQQVLRRWALPALERRGLIRPGSSGEFSAEPP